ncbi:MAG: hypothetical protein HKN42_05400, partial [Granulosicoccus sp.]|nr:hypothetical protein [Granulosicoccus sp.]
MSKRRQVTPLRIVRIFLVMLASGFASGCASTNHLPTRPPDARFGQAMGTVMAEESSRLPATPAATEMPEPATRIIDAIQQIGTLEDAALDEVSGMAASRTIPGVLFAINDSGAPAMLFAFDDSGAHLRQWHLEADNRDWEDMA